MKNLIKMLLLIGFALVSTNGAYADFSFNNMELRFGQVSDTHISDSEDTTYKVLSGSKELLRSAIQDLNKIGSLDFVAFTGDMVNEPTLKLYKDFFIELSELKHPSLLVFGNHDVVKNSDGMYLDKNSVNEIIQKYSPYQKYGKPYFAYSPNESYRVIVLDTTVGHEHDSNGFLPDEQLNFLDNEINQNQDKVIIIFQHHPVVEPFKSNTHKLLNANAYVEVLKKYEKVPIAIFTGHYHAAKIIKRGNVVHISSPSLVTYPNAYRTVVATNYRDRVIFNIKLHETNMKTLQQRAKSGLVASALFSGASSDRNAEIMIRKGNVPKDIYTKEEVKAKRIEEQNEAKRMKAYEKEQKAAEKARKKFEKQERKRVKKEMKKGVAN